MADYRERLRERPVQEPSTAPVERSEAAEVRANLELVIAAMDTAPASAIAPLSRRREELDNRLRKLEEAGQREVALSDTSTDQSFAEMMRSAGLGGVGL